MEFKGTKGKWKVEQVDRDSSGRSVYRVSTWNIPDNSELKYNSKLISKAPEMLEMLKLLLPVLSDNKETGWKYDVEKLIKEATTI